MEQHLKTSIVPRVIYKFSQIQVLDQFDFGFNSVDILLSIFVHFQRFIFAQLYRTLGPAFDTILRFCTRCTRSIPWFRPPFTPDPLIGPFVPAPSLGSAPHLPLTR